MYILTDLTGKYHVSEGGGLTKTEDSYPMTYPSSEHAKIYARNIAVRTPLLPVEKKTSDMMRLIKEERGRLLAAQLCPRHDLEFLTYAAVSISAISQGKAAELLGVTILDLREGLTHWLIQQPGYVQKAAESAQNYSLEETVAEELAQGFAAQINQSNGYEIAIVQGNTITITPREESNGYRLSEQGKDDAS